jgi:hypothetical protein
MATLIGSAGVAALVVGATGQRTSHADSAQAGRPCDRLLASLGVRGTLIGFFCCVVLTNPTWAADPAFAHVRSDEASFRSLVADGYRRSATFKALVDEIDTRPGIVYIEPTAKLSQGMAGGLLHAAAGSPSFPVLRVLLKGHPSGDRGIALIAHELQHVVEAVRAGDASNSVTMAQFFASLDAAHDRGASKFETEAAGQVERDVLEELRRPRHPSISRDP